VWVGGVTSWSIFFLKKWHAAPQRIQEGKKQ
jgi:hypothetical protein